jgi:hypothetical protein
MPVGDHDVEPTVIGHVGHGDAETQQVTRGRADASCDTTSGPESLAPVPAVRLSFID